MYSDTGLEVWLNGEEDIYLYDGESVEEGKKEKKYGWRSWKRMKEDTDMGDG